MLDAGKRRNLPKTIASLRCARNDAYEKTTAIWLDRRQFPARKACQGTRVADDNCRPDSVCHVMPSHTLLSQYPQAEIGFGPICAGARSLSSGAARSASRRTMQALGRHSTYVDGLRKPGTTQGLAAVTGTRHAPRRVSLARRAPDFALAEQPFSNNGEIHAPPKVVWASRASISSLMQLGAMVLSFVQEKQVLAVGKFCMKFSSRIRVQVFARRYDGQLRKHSSNGGLKLRVSGVIYNDDLSAVCWIIRSSYGFEQRHDFIRSVEGRCYNAH